MSYAVGDLLKQLNNGMKAVGQEKPGGPETLVIDEAANKPQPGSKHLLMKVVYSAINRADTLQRKGNYAPPPNAVSSLLGLEAAGHIDSFGIECSEKWKKEDRVMALLNGGGYAEYAVVHEDHLMPIPDHMTFKEAAAIPEVWLTAFQLLYFIGDVQPSEDVLIHAGGSGVGTAAIQLVVHRGARAIVTAGTKEKLKKAKELGAALGINYKSQNFATEVLKFTDNKGVNIILDCVGGSHADKNIKALATDGRWVLYGLLGGPKVEGPFLGSLLRKRASLTATTLRSRSDEYKARLVAEFTAKILPSFHPESEKRLFPIIDKVFPLEEIIKAHTYMDNNKTIGKVLLDVSAEKKVTEQEQTVSEVTEENADATHKEL